MAFQELCEKGVEITVTFKPEIHRLYAGDTLTDMVRVIFAGYKRRYQFKLMMIGEYSKVGMYHMHGSIVAPPKMINSIRRRLAREIGRTEIQMIRDTGRWASYCLKDEHKSSNDKYVEKEVYRDEIIVM